MGTEEDACAIGEPEPELGELPMGTEEASIGEEGSDDDALRCGCWVPGDPVMSMALLDA